MQYRFSPAFVLLTLSIAIAPTVAQAQDEINGGSGRDLPALGRGNFIRNLVRRAPSNGAVVQGNGINYHGGPVMKDAVRVYIIWYGNWAQDPNAATIVTNWANSIGGSPYEAINSTYGDNTGNVTGAVSYVASTSNLSAITSLTDSSITNIVASALSSGALPTDANGVYFVLTAPGVKETSGFLTQYCGWHTSGFINGMDIKYAFVGDAAGSSLGNCAAQTAKSPNADPAVDAMVSVMAHELEEAASDPDLNAWYDSNGNENADKCAWTFGATYPAANGSAANMNLGGHDYLIQQNWVNAKGGYCALSYATTAPDFSLAVLPQSQTVTAGGGTGAYVVTAKGVNGWLGKVTYSVTSALPLGAGASVLDNNITISTSSNTPGGTFPFTISGTDGSLTRTTSATLVVNALPTPTYSISITPSSQTVRRGNSGTYVVTVTPQNSFNEVVALSTSGAKTGIGLSLSPTSLTGGGTSTLTATVNLSAKRGNVTITVTGQSGTSGITKSASASLQVQ